MARILIIDSYYPDFINSLPVISYATPRTYEEELALVLDHHFGTGDSYSYHLKQQGWDAIDIIANYHGLQHKWAHDFNASGTLDEILLAQIAYYKPEVLFFQDLSVLPAATLENLRQRYLLAGQCSCPMPDIERVRQFAVLFTSFPHYIRRFEEVGVKAIYMALAFDERFASSADLKRNIDIAFVGGVGRDSHWLAGTDLLELVASEFPHKFQWWGYGVERLSSSSRLLKCYQGQAWGNEMYGIYRRSKIVINRHGEVAGPYANNLRLFESTGSGALLITEDRKNLWNLFSAREISAYITPQHAISEIRDHLEHENIRRFVAKCGQQRTLKTHTYSRRMKDVSDHLTAMLCPA